MYRVRQNSSTSPVNIMCLMLFLSNFLSTPTALTGGDRWRGGQTSEGTDAEGNIRGSRDDTGAVSGRNATSGLPDQSIGRTHQRARQSSRTSYETWVLNEIKDMILNATGRSGVGPFHRPSGPRVESNPLLPGSPSVSPPVNRSQRPTGRRNPVEEVTFPPDEVSKHRNDAFIQFTLHNYTGKGLEGAELMLLLRYNNNNNRHQPPANHQPPNLGQHHRKPDVRRVSIEVYKDTGNATHDGNASSMTSSSMTSSSMTSSSSNRTQMTSSSSNRTPMTSSLFRIRRTKWVKVLLIRSWVKDAAETEDKVLRLRLVYDGSGAVDLVMTGRDRTRTTTTTTTTGRRKRKRNLDRGGRNLRDGSSGGDQRIAKRNLDRRNLFSPLLVIRQRGKSTS